MRLCRSRCALVTVLAIAFASGCGGSGVYPVEGIVEWSDGGPANALEGASLTFELPEKNTNSVGVVKSDGTFQLMTAEPGDGALPGDYTVVLSERRQSAGGSMLAPTKADIRYATRETSDLKATVHPKKNTGADRLVLKVDKAK